MVGASAGMPTFGARLADGGQPGADRQLTGDEVRAAGGAARLGVVVGERMPCGGQLVEIRRSAGHHALVVGADVKPADVVAHDDDDVRLSTPSVRRLRAFANTNRSSIPRRCQSCRTGRNRSAGTR
jgi:hypothetical protein